MPVIIVYGIPENYPLEKLEKFMKALQSGVQFHPSLKLQTDQVSVFFPRDRVQKGLGEEIIIFVESLFEKKGRTVVVKTQYARTLVRISKDFFPDALVECFIRPFVDEENIFWNSKYE